MSDIGRIWDGYCTLTVQAIISIYEKEIPGNPGSPPAKTWRVNIRLIAITRCEEKEGWKGSRVRMANEVTDKTAQATIAKRTICSMCDTSCGEETIGVWNLSDKGSGNLPARFRRLRNSLNGQCFEEGGEPLGSESLRNRIGPDNRRGEDVIQDIGGALEELMGDATIASVIPDCDSSSCACGDEDPPQVFGLANTTFPSIVD